MVGSLEIFNPMALYPAYNDSGEVLWKKIAWNMYEYAIKWGAVGLTPPNWNDSQEVLQKKVTYYTAAIPRS